MPFVGLGLHVLVALYFAIHAVRTGREIYWLIILFSFPLLGSIVYFLVVYLPDSRLQRGLRQAKTVAVKSLDPGRDLRAAREAFELTPTAQNQMRLAAALLESGDTNQALEHYQNCLQGPFGNDPDIRYGAARARLANGDGAVALALLESIRRDSPDFRPESVAITYAQTLALNARSQEAREAFQAAVDRFDSVEARVEYAIWALAQGDSETALRLRGEIEHAMRYWNKHTRNLNKPLLQRLNGASLAAGNK